MSKTIARQKKARPQKPRQKSKRKSVLIICSLLILTLAVGVIAQWKILPGPSKPLALAPPPQASFAAQSPSKEYIYAGSRLIATEEPTSTTALINLAQNRPATQSSTSNSASASLAVDGNTSGLYADGSVALTNSQSQAWWQVDLGAVQSIQTIKVWNRVEAPERTSNFYVFVSDQPFTSTDLTTTLNQAGVSSYHTSGQCGRPTAITVNRTGRYVRVQLAGTNYLQLAEVEILGTPGVSNLALGRPATQSTTINSALPGRAVDGNTSGLYANGSVSSTNSQSQAWWQVDLGAVQSIQTIKVWNRVEAPERTSNFYVFVSDQPFTSTDLNTTLNQAGVSDYYTQGTAGFPTTLTVNRTGRYVRVQLTGTNYLQLAEVEVWGIATLPPAKVNYALATRGAVASASSTYTSSYSPSYTNNGNRHGVWGSGGGWIDGTSAVFPDYLQIDFSGAKTIDEIDVFSLQDNYWSPVDPTEEMTFTYYGITSFEVQYWNGSAWITVPGGSVTGNNKIWRKFTFSEITTTKIRVVINGSADGWSRVTEIEAWGN